jgi:hypothetical protein
MFHGHLDHFQKPPLGGRPTTKPGDHGITNAHKHWFVIFIMCKDPHEHKFINIAFGWGPGHIWLHTTLEGPWPHYMILEVCWDGLGTLSFGLSQFHGHGSWLMSHVWSGPNMMATFSLRSWTLFSFLFFYQISNVSYDVWLHATIWSSWKWWSGVLPQE